MKLLLGIAVGLALMASAAEARSPVTCFDGDRVVQCAVQHRAAKITARKSAKRTKTVVRTETIAPVIRTETIAPVIRGDLVSRAERYMGSTAAQLGVRRSLWCAAFMNKILGGGTGSNISTSYKRYGTPAPQGCVGCIAVTLRKGGYGHVGVVKSWNGHGALIISGNHNNRVDEGVYPRSRIVALRWP